MSKEILKIWPNYPFMSHHGTHAPHAFRWRNMMSRCYNDKNPRFIHYGARGIKVCAEWHDFWNFFHWATKTYEQGKTLDRINNNLGYAPDNCRWADYSTQMKNRRLTPKIVTHMQRARKIQYERHILVYGDPTTRTVKTCSLCREVKSLEFFHRLTKSKDGRNAYCKNCNNMICRNRKRARREEQNRTST